MWNFQLRNDSDLPVAGSSHKLRERGGEAEQEAGVAYRVQGEPDEGNQRSQQAQDARGQAR